MSLQRQHFLLSYFKTLSVGPVKVWTCDLPHGSPVLYGSPVRQYERRTVSHGWPGLLWEKIRSRKRSTLDIKASKHACGIPGMNKELKEWMPSCEACREFKQGNPHEPRSLWTSSRENNLFLYHGKYYFVTICHKSNFWELESLAGSKSSTAIKKLKAHLDRYGIPRQLISDNGSEFVFTEFSPCWCLRPHEMQHL